MHPFGHTLQGPKVGIGHRAKLTKTQWTTDFDHLLVSSIYSGVHTPILTIYKHVHLATFTQYCRCDMPRTHGNLFCGG